MLLLSITKLLRHSKVDRLQSRSCSIFLTANHEDINRSKLTRLNVTQTTHARRHLSRAGFLQGIAQSTPVLFAQDTLIYLHDFSQLPWWAVIVLTTVGVRFLITFPFTVYQSVVLAKYANLQPEIKQLMVALRGETARAVKLYNWNEKRAKEAFFKSLRKHRQELIVRDNCHPFKASIVIWVQIPVWITISFALRNIVYGMAGQDVLMSYLSMGTEGALWFSNLTVPDPIFALPVLLGLVNLAIVEYHALKAPKTNKFQKVITWTFRCFSVVMIPIAATVPSCLALYWCTSSCVGLLHNILLTSPSVRRMCRIPAVKGDSPTPFTDIWNKIKNRKQPER